jgi:peptidoglycan/LPS O-acetylase OafA/YrhL
MSMSLRERTRPSLGIIGNDSKLVVIIGPNHSPVPSMSDKPRQHAFVALDGLRGLAAVAVVSYHVNVTFGVARWLPSAYLAVDIFFVLSGFVLAHAYDNRLAKGMTAAQFMAARLLRLYPVFLLALALGLAALLAAKILGHDTRASLHGFAHALPWNVAFLPSATAWTEGSDLFPTDPPAWSLFFELVVNFAFAVTWTRLNDRALLAVIATAAAALLFATFRFGPPSGGMNAETLFVGFARCFLFVPARGAAVPRA